MADTELDFADIRAALKQPAPTPAEPEANTAEESAPTEEVKGDEKAPEGEEKQPPATEKVEDKKDKRFSKLTKERDTERNARVALEARLAALEASAAGKKPETASAAPVADGRPEKPNSDKFATYKEYEAAKEEYDEKLSDWKVAQALAKKETEAAAAKAKQAWENTNKAWQSQIDDATEENDDIEDAINAVGTSVGRKGIIEVIKESPVGVKMVLYLHRNPAELAKIDDMTVATAARYLGRVEERLERETAPAATKPAAKALPKPPSIVGGAPSSVGKGFDFQNASDADFKSMLLKQDGFSYLKRG